MRDLILSILDRETADQYWAGISDSLGLPGSDLDTDYVLTDEELTEYAQELVDYVGDYDCEEPAFEADWPQIQAELENLYDSHYNHGHNAGSGVF